MRADLERDWLMGDGRARGGGFCRGKGLGWWVVEFGVMACEFVGKLVRYFPIIVIDYRFVYFHGDFSSYLVLVTQCFDFVFYRVCSRSVKISITRG